MFRMTRYIKSLMNPVPVRPVPKPSGPVVIWNLIRRCNLTCKHCYSISADIDFKGELTTQEVYKVMDDLKAFGVPVLILSGGEPLMRPDIFDISHRAKAMGFYVGLSTNGTLITEDNISKIAEVGYDYVGISIDGLETPFLNYGIYLDNEASGFIIEGNLVASSVTANLFFHLGRDNQVTNNVFVNAWNSANSKGELRCTVHPYNMCAPAVHVT